MSEAHDVRAEEDPSLPFHAAYEKEAEEQGLLEDAHLEYDEWLEETGLDPSFVGMPERGIPGTWDLYAAAVRVIEREPAPEATAP